MSEEIKTNEQSNAGQTIIVNQQEKKNKWCWNSRFRTCFNCNIPWLDFQFLVG